MLRGENDSKQSDEIQATLASLCQKKNVYHRNTVTFVPITIRIALTLLIKITLNSFFKNFLNSNEELLIYQDLVKN